MLALLCAVLSITSYGTAAPTTKSVDLLMPEVQPQKPDTYLCRSLDVSELKPYITGFQPNANKDIAHHILLYGCTVPGSQKEVWNCGEMAVQSSDYEVRPVCAEGSKILYAWAMDAPSLTLPKDVAFKVGGDTGINTLAMQVHYKNVSSFLPPQSKKDSSGITLTTTDEPKGRTAGVYLMVTDGMIPAGKTEYLEAACPFPGDDMEIHPFAFRTHTHTLGRVVSGYRVRDGQWTEIGRQDPRKPQMFYNTTNPDLTVRPGDILVARCTMENKLDHDVRVGPTQSDEMCNFYIMYFTDGDKDFSGDVCFSKGGPNWYLKDYPDQAALNRQAMPASASQVPGSDAPLQATTRGAEVEEDGEEEEEGNEEDEVEEELEQGGDDSPVIDELLDEYLAEMDPEDLNALVDEMTGRQRPRPQAYQDLPQYLPQEQYDRGYNSYINYPEEEFL